jgi:hypothetical protein
MAGLCPGHDGFWRVHRLPPRYRFALSACSVAVQEIPIV